MPYLVTLHTVLSEPTWAPPDRIVHVPHGAPEPVTDYDSSHTIGPEVRRTLDALAGRRLLSTFGLISPGKGEDYREDLMRAAKEAGVADRVAFLDSFLTENEIGAILAQTEVFCTPYRSREQISSGALTFAVAAGKPVVSTACHYAVDMLGDGAGITVPPEDPEAFAGALRALLGDDARVTAARRAARERATGLRWDAVAQRFAAARAARNMLTVKGRWLDEPHSGDHVGRLIWALGEIMAAPALLADGARAGNAEIAGRGLIALDWYLRQVGDAGSGGCRDGLGAVDTNPNQGAESTPAYYQARLGLIRAGLATRGISPSR